MAVPLVAAFALLALLFAALPASAQVTQADSCTLVKEIKLSGGTIGKGEVVQDGTKSLKDATFPTSPFEIKEWGIVCLINTINVIIDWISLIVLILSTALIVYAGFLWMTGGDNPENKDKAGKVILAALIGFGIVILAKVLPAVISGILL